MRGLLKIVSSLLLLQLSFSTTAQEYPSKPVKLIVPSTAGVITDFVPRILAPEMSKLLRQPIVIENKPGAGGIIAAEAVLQAPPDGYTITMVTVPGLSLLPVTSKNLRFDPLKDLPPVLEMAEGKFTLSSPTNQPWKSFSEWLAYAKANPGKMNWGTAAPVTQFPMEMLIGAVGIDVVYIPYKESIRFSQALLTGEVQVAISTEATALAYGDSKIRVLAVTGQRRAALFPSAPTFTELGYPEMSRLGISYSLNVRSGTPKEATDKLYAATSAVLRQANVKDQLAKLQLSVIDEAASADAAATAAARSLADQAKVFAGIARKIGFVPQ